MLKGCNPQNVEMRDARLENADLRGSRVKTEFTLTAPAGTKQVMLDLEETLLRR